MTTVEVTTAGRIGHRQIVTTMPIDEVEEPLITGSEVGGDEGHQRVMRRIVNPAHLALLIGPVALVVVIPLIHIHALAREPMWIWLAVLVAAPIGSLGVDRLYGARPSRLTLNLRTAEHAATVTFVIYLTGWGPALCIAFAFMALENVSHGGSRVWPTSATWIILGLIVGQIFIWQGWAPSKLSIFDANSLAIMSGFILLFVIRLAGATMERKEAAELSTRLSEDRFRSLIQNSSDTTVVVAVGGVISYASPSVTELLGYEPSQLIGRLATDLIHADDREWVMARLSQQVVDSPEGNSIQFRMERVDGLWRYVEAVVTNQVDRPSVAGYVANIRDVTERMEYETLLAHRALHDPLTGLGNRQLILDRAEQMVARSHRWGEPIAAFFIDIDNFKDINDSLGHEIGDRLLEAIAARFDGLFRAEDTIGRMGGDEFVILAEGATLVRGPQLVAERIHDVLRQPFALEGFESFPIVVTASIGIATGDRPSAQELIRDADVALYKAKASGRDQSAFYSPDMHSAALDRLELRSELDSAIANDEFFLLYQPIFDLTSMDIQGVEALIRWRHPTKGVIAPDCFIPVLEESGLIVNVGRWVIDTACAQAGRWRDRGFATTMSVNVSMKQLERDALVDEVESAIVANQLDPGSLTIEVTESALMRDVVDTMERLNRLKAIGVSLAIDDFGTGYSSLAYLRRFPVDVVKIDKSFISEIDDSPNSAAFIHTLVELGRTLGLITIAEGIEDDAQLTSLRNELCDRGQGYLFSRPVDPDRIEELLKQSHHRRLALPRP